MPCTYSDLSTSTLYLPAAHNRYIVTRARLSTPNTSTPTRHLSSKMLRSSRAAQRGLHKLAASLNTTTTTSTTMSCRHTATQLNVPLSPCSSSLAPRTLQCCHHHSQLWPVQQQRAASVLVQAAAAASAAGNNPSAGGSRSRPSRRSRTVAAPLAAPGDEPPKHAAASPSSKRGRKSTAVLQQQQQPPHAEPQAAAAVRKRAAAGTPGGSSRTKSPTTSANIVQGPHVALSQPLPHVLILHTGGTLGMDAAQSFEVDPHQELHNPPVLKRGTGGTYRGCARGLHVIRGWWLGVLLDGRLGRY